MTELRQMIQTHLLTLHPRVYFQVAPEDAVYPYLVFDIPNIFDDGEWFKRATIDVDGWDLPSNLDTTVLETLMNTVRDGMNKYTITSATSGVSLFLSSMHALQEDDKRIKRRKYVFEAHLFERSN